MLMSKALAPAPVRLTHPRTTTPTTTTTTTPTTTTTTTSAGSNPRKLSIMAEPNAKYRRLADLRARLPHMSQSAMAAFIREAQRELPEIGGRTESIRRARRIMLDVQTPYGPLIQSLRLDAVKGSPIDIPVLHPWAMLHVASQQCPGFAKLLRATLQRQPCSPLQPWDLCVYGDEVTPGNKQKAANARKVWAIYFSFLSFGGAVLCNEHAWLVPIVIRTVVLKMVRGGVSALIGGLLKLFFDDACHNMRTSGISLRLHAQAVDAAAVSVRVFAKFAALLADEQALHYTWMCKGSSGNKPCCQCMNIVRHDWWVEHVGDPTHYFKPHSVTDPDALDLHSRESIRCILADLAHARTQLSKTDMAAKQTRVGWTDDTHNLLLDPALAQVVDPTEQNVYDWAHCYVVQGVFNLQVGLMMTELKPSGITYATLHEYNQLWTWPSRVTMASGKNAMDEARAKGSWKLGKFNLQASEALSIYPVMAQWVRSVLLPSGQHAACGQAFLRLAHVLDLLLACPRGSVTPRQLQDAIAQHLQAFAAAFGAEQLPPKGHYPLHLPKVLAKFGHLPNTLPLERKHKVVKRYADSLENTSSRFDRSLLEEVTCEALHALGREDIFCNEVRLVEARHPPKRLLDILQGAYGLAPHYLSARTCRHSPYGTCSVGDVVLVNYGGGSMRAGRVVFHASVGEDLITGLSAWDLVSMAETFSTWRMESQEPLHVIAPTSILEVCIWAEDTTSCRATVLHPITAR